MGYGNRINKLRERGKLSRQELANKTGLSVNQIGKIENEERRPSFEILSKMSEIFSVSIDYILTGKNYTAAGMAENQPFVGMGELADTSLARSMFQTLQQISTRVNTIADGVQHFDRIGKELSNLKALEGTASALSINPEHSRALVSVKNDAMAVNQ